MHESPSRWPSAPADEDRDDVPFQLSRIAGNLEALEETIIHRLVDRAQFRADRKAYQAGQSGFDGEDERSLLEVRLAHHEAMDATFGRYCDPVERPFTGGLPASRRAVTLGVTGLAVDDFDVVNRTAGILAAYLQLVPRFCPAGDDRQYGSCTEHDVAALQAIARRVHYGALYVAESKWRAASAELAGLAAAGDDDGLLKAITRPDVEAAILDRVAEKAANVQSCANSTVRQLVAPDVIVAFYRDTVIPLTKEGQVAYLLNRRRDR